MKRGKSRSSNNAHYLIIAVVLVLVISVIVFSSYDLLEKTITGFASSSSTNLSITLAGPNNSVVNFISAVGTITPIEYNYTEINFTYIVTDVDGVDDINNSAATANFSKSTATTRENTSCINFGNKNGTARNFSCSIRLWYFDQSGTWTVTAYSNDLGNKTMNYTSTTFTFSELKALAIGTSNRSLSWDSISPGQRNKTSINDPTIINNTGNFNGTLNVTALNLLGQTDSSYQIHAENFTLGLTTGAGNPECNITGSNMTNNTAVTVIGSFANQGNLSIQDGSGEEQVYYCLRVVNTNLTSQAYSTTALGSWTIAYINRPIIISQTSYINMYPKI